MTFVPKNGNSKINNLLLNYFIKLLEKRENSFFYVAVHFVQSSESISGM